MEQDLFPSGVELANADAGDLVLRSGTYQAHGVSLRADYGTLIVPENRDRPGSGLIHLPVARLPAMNRAGEAPIFIFNGGPGLSNIIFPPSWFHEDRDLVLVGYRGVDGSVSLDCPEVVKVLAGFRERPLSSANLARLGQAMHAAFRRLRADGIDLDSYTMLNVIDDMEAAREALGYDRIHLWAHSYGVQLAYLYSVRFPETIHRCAMFGPSAPEHLAFFETRVVDDLLDQYAELWRQDPAAVSRTPDLLQTMRRGLQQLPAEWRGIPIDPDKVKFMSFLMLYDVGTAAQMFGAFVAAEEGELSGLAYLSVAFDKQAPRMMKWGDFYSKLYSSSDIYLHHDYESEMDLPDSVLGSPLLKTLLVPVKHGGWPIRQIPAAQRTGPSEVETLVVGGNMDFSTSLDHARRFLLPRLRRASLLVFKEMGHGDVLALQPDAYRHLCQTFYQSGEVDDTKFCYQPMNFVPAVTFQDEARKLIPAESGV